MKRFLTSLALLLCATLAASAQPPVTGGSPLKNRFDSLGRKTGYWTEESPSSVACLFYRDGLKNGLARFYNKTPVGNFLTAVGSYSDGHESGQWMHFFENGRSVAIVRDSISVSADHDLCWQVFPGVMQRGEPVLSCHAAFYDESGFIRAEGRGLYYEGPSFFETFQRTGVWIFYNPDGSSFRGRYCPPDRRNAEYSDQGSFELLDEYGNILRKKQNSEYDAFYIIQQPTNNQTLAETNDENHLNNKIIFPHNTVTAVRNPSYISIDQSTGIEINTGSTMFEIAGDDNAKQLFEFLSSNETGTLVEWVHAKIGTEKSGRNIVGTNHLKASTSIGGYLKFYNYHIRDIAVR